MKELLTVERGKNRDKGYMLVGLIRFVRGVRLVSSTDEGQSTGIEEVRSSEVIPVWTSEERRGDSVKG